MRQLANLICLEYLWMQYPKRIWLQAGGGIFFVPSGMTREQFLINDIVGKWMRGYDGLSFDK